MYWTQPSIVYKNVFKRSVWSYFIKYGFFAALTLVTCFVTTYICNYLIVGENFISLIIKGFICLIVPNIVYFIIFFKTNEFQYLFNIIKTYFLKLKGKKQLAKGM